MQTKYKVILGITAAIGLVALGRYTAPDTIKVETKVVEVEKQVYVDKVTNTKVTKLPDGTVTRETIVTDKTKTDTETTKTSEKTETPVSKLHLSAMGGYKAGSLVWGISATKPILGPIVLGVWGLSDLTFGASIGLAL